MDPCTETEMSKININLDHSNKPHVICAMPAALAALTNEDGSPRFGYATKTFDSHHIDNGQRYVETFEITGVFKDNSSGAYNNLVKATQIVFDCDLVDVLMDGDSAKLGTPTAAESVQWAKDMLTSRFIETVHGGGGKKIAVADADPSDLSKPQNRDIVKAALVSLPAEDLKARMLPFMHKHLDKMSEMLSGVVPTMINYSGTGYHLHYAIADSDGWTSDGIAMLPEAERDNKFANIVMMKAAYKGLNGAFKVEFGHSWDDKLSQIGTAATRNIGMQNRKNSQNVKLVEQMDVRDESGNARWSADSRITLNSFVVQAAQSGAAQSSAAASGAKRGPGRPAKQEHRNPVHISEEHQITYLDPKHGQLTISVDQLRSNWAEMVDAGVITERETFAGKTYAKLKVRLDWVSQGSLNSWVKVALDDEDVSLVFICDVANYAQHDDPAWWDVNGKMVGHWIFKGGMWSKLERTEKGKILQSQHNLEIIVSLHPELMGKIRFNTRAGEDQGLEIRGDLYRSLFGAGYYFISAMTDKSWAAAPNAVVPRISKIVEDVIGHRPNQDALREAINEVANQNAVEPIHQWIQSTSWDGTHRLDNWLPEVLGLPRSHKNYGIYSAYGRVAMLSIVRTQYNLKDQTIGQQNMLILQGSQGCGKSTFAATLGLSYNVGRQYFSDSELNLNKPADLALQLAGKVVAEVPELDAMNKADNNTVKNLITRTEERQRTAYARFATTFIKTAFLVGTTNNRAILRDTTGSRRFLIVDFDDLPRDAHGITKRWDQPLLISIIPQLYAEAYQRVVLGQHIPAHRAAEVCLVNGSYVESWQLARHEALEQAEHNEGYDAVDTKLEVLRELLNGYYLAGTTAKVALSDVKARLKSQRDVEYRIDRELGNAMIQLGWVNYKTGGVMKWRITPEGEKMIKAQLQAEEEAKAKQSAEPADEPEFEPAAEPAAAEPAAEPAATDINDLVSRAMRGDFSDNPQITKLVKKVKAEPTLMDSLFTLMTRLRAKLAV